MRWAAAQPKPDDRGVLGGLAGFPGAGPCAQQVGQHQAAQPQRTNFEEITARAAVAIGSRAGTEQVQHGWLLVVCLRDLETNSQKCSGRWDG